MKLPMVQLSIINKNLQLLNTLSLDGFSGRLTFKEQSTPPWVVVMQSGAIIYVTGGHQSLRRWYRYFLWTAPNLAANFQALQKQLAAVEDPILEHYPEYHLLYNWTSEGKLTPEQLQQIVQAIAIEVLFDVLQATDAEPHQQTAPLALPPETLVNSDTVLASVTQLWQRWQAAELPDYPLSQIPVIQQPDQLKAATSPQAYQALSTIINGKRNLWEIAAKTRKDVIQIVKPLHPFLGTGCIELIERPQPQPPAAPARPAPSTGPSKVVVACVDDSVMVCRALETVTRSLGHGFVGISDPARAIATLLIRKPEIIFLDLIMPETNGYEICTQLRKTTQFKETPIIILTGNDGVVDQVRARLLGATDFIGKPVDPTIISNLIRKYVRMPN